VAAHVRLPPSPPRARRTRRARRGTNWAASRAAPRWLDTRT
jgi:hypothetical protein